MDIKISDRKTVEFIIDGQSILVNIRRGMLKIEADNEISIEPTASNCINIHHLTSSSTRPPRGVAG